MLFFDSLISKSDLVKDVWEVDKNEFGSHELMEMERLLLGIYLREHPAYKTMKQLRGEWCTKIQDLDEKQGLKTTVVGIIKSVKVVMTKAKNQEMAFVALSDEGGEVDTVIFPKTYQTAKEFLIDNAVIRVKGRVDEREDRLSLVADSVEAVASQDEPDQAERALPEDHVVVPRGTSKATLLELNKLLQGNRGNDQITLVFQNGHGNRELALPFGVNYDAKLKKEIQSLLTIDPIE